VSNGSRALPAVVDFGLFGHCSSHGSAPLHVAVHGLFDWQPGNMACLSAHLLRGEAACIIRSSNDRRCVLAVLCLCCRAASWLVMEQAAAC
jgi:hypothetical protein